MSLVKGQSAPRRGWSPLCAQEGGKRDPGKAGWAQTGKGWTPRARRPEWTHCTTGTPMMSEHQRFKYSPRKGGQMGWESLRYLQRGWLRRSPVMGGSSCLWHGGHSARGWDPALVKSWTEGSHMCRLFLQELDTSQGMPRAGPGSRSATSAATHRTAAKSRTTVSSTDRPFRRAIGTG